MGNSVVIELVDRLRRAGVPITFPRLEIARVLLSAPIHLSADQVLSKVRETAPDISRATVYNTLKLFREKNLIRELLVEPERVIYDSNIHPHHHLYNIDTGELMDFPDDALQLTGMPDLPEHTEIVQTDVIVKIREKRM